MSYGQGSPLLWCSFDLRVILSVRYLIAVFVFILLLSSCLSDGPEYKPVTLTVRVSPAVEDEPITLTSRKTGRSEVRMTNTEGIVSFEVTKGQYDLVAEKTNEKGKTVNFGRIDYVTLYRPEEELTIPLTLFDLGKEPSFVLDELYFNGSMGKRKWKTIFNDQYFTICNNSDYLLYADGLSVGITGDYNYIPWKTDMDYVLPDYVAVTQIYTIPGKGMDVPVKPGESLVICRSAINHVRDPELDIHTPDLSGADFEVYVPHPFSVTVDNPEVPNMIVSHSHYQAFDWHFDGGNPIFIFKVDDVAKLVRENAIKCVNAAWQGGHAPKYVTCIKVPTSSIIDGVETGCKNYLLKLCLPEVVDRGAFLIPGYGTQTMGSSHQGFFLKRIEIVEPSGRIRKKDTNNSGHDFQMILEGQKSYPAKNKKKPQ